MSMIHLNQETANPLLTVHNAVSDRPVHACDVVYIYAQENDKTVFTCMHARRLFCCKIIHAVGFNSYFTIIILTSSLFTFL